MGFEASKIANGSVGFCFFSFRLTDCFPTDPFTTSELQNPSHDVSELHKNCRSPDLEPLKLWKVRSGWLIIEPEGLFSTHTQQLRKLWFVFSDSLQFTHILRRPQNPGIGKSYSVQWRRSPDFVECTEQGAVISYSSYEFAIFCQFQTKLYETSYLTKLFITFES